MKLNVATANPGKLHDFATAAASYDCDIAPLPNLSHIEPAPEDGLTFADNARAKALYYASHTLGLIVVADDSGLEVDALDGAPGVHSARFSADAGLSSFGGIDAANNAYLLQRLIEIPHAKRTARYRCALAAAIDGRVIAEARGTVEGTILTSPRGMGGFGYDPLFFLTHGGKTMAEIDLETKLQLSHRGAALRNLLSILSAQS